MLEENGEDKWSKKVANEEILERTEEKRMLLNNILRRKPIGLGIFKEKLTF